MVWHLLPHHRRNVADDDATTASAVRSAKARATIGGMSLATTKVTHWA